MNGRHMRRFALSPLTVGLMLMLLGIAPQQASVPTAAQAPAQPAAAQTTPAQPTSIPLELFKVPDG